MSTTSLPISRRANGAIEWVPLPVEQLRPNEQNPRSITKARFEDLKHSLAADPEMLQTRPLVALPDGRVIMGNMRLRAALELGWQTIPTVVVELDEERAQQWLLRDNVPYGDWVEEGLAEMMYGLHQSSTDMRLTGFDSDSIKRMLESVAPGGVDPADLPPAGALRLADVSVAPPENTVQRGEVVTIGEHTLVCADVFSGHAKWRDLLTDEVTFVPYPSPAVALSQFARTHKLLLVQPDEFIAGHILDKYAAVMGKESIERA